MIFNSAYWIELYSVWVTFVDIVVVTGVFGNCRTCMKLPVWCKPEILLFMQSWVISTVVKMTLKTFEECVRLQTFNRSGYQQIQLDCHYLREPLQNLVDNGTVVEIMLDEVMAQQPNIKPGIGYS